MYMYAHFTPSHTPTHKLSMVHSRLCVVVRVWSVTIGTGGIGLHQTCVNRDVLGGGEGGEGGESGVMLW